MQDTFCQLGCYNSNIAALLFEANTREKRELLMICGLQSSQSFSPGLLTLYLSFLFDLVHTSLKAFHGSALLQNRRQKVVNRRLYVRAGGELDIDI